MRISNNTSSGTSNFLSVNERTIENRTNRQAISLTKGFLIDDSKKDVDGMRNIFSRSRGGYFTIVKPDDQELIRMNNSNVSALMNHITNPSGLNNKYFPSKPLNAYWNESGRNHQIYMENNFQGLGFYAPTLDRYGGGMYANHLAIFRENRPPAYFNGMKPDHPTLSMMAMSGLDVLQR